MSSIIRSTQVLAAVLLFLQSSLPATAAAVTQREVAEVKIENPRPQPWPDEVQQAFASIPVQDRGRVKPLATYAGFRMLNLNGKRKYEIPEGFGLPASGEKLDPVTWLLDVVLFREQARHYEIFLVTDNAVLKRIGLEFEGRKRRDRYSFNQLRPGRQKLEEEALRLEGKDRNDRTRIETQLLTLRSNLIEYDLLELMFESLHTTLGDDPSERLLELFPEGRDGAEVPLGLVLSRWDTVAEWMASATSPELGAAVQDELAGLAVGVDGALGRAPFSLAIVPPEDRSEEQWRSPGSVGLAVFQRTAPVGESEFALLNSLAGIWAARGDMEAAGAAIVDAQTAMQAAAEARGEFEGVPLELTYYRGKFFLNAFVCFLLAFVLVAISWIVPRSKVLIGSVWGLTSIGLIVAVTGVTIRCILLGRPPVATLYETILFITSTAVLVCLVAERMTRERIMLAIGAALGAAGMLLSMRYEVIEASQQGDTMGGLVAVLNTNFWLATHVTTVTLGYSAGLLAAALGHIWLAMRLGRAAREGGRSLPKKDADFYRGFARIIYGVICFGLLFSVVGTILGGVWANDSWGRFWGWDPKENGALMIVLFELVILHARLGGYIRDFGVALMSVVGGAVVAFSWWHVNQLGVGLHSYGFTEGVLTSLRNYYFIVVAFVALSLLGRSIWLRQANTVKSA